MARRNLNVAIAGTLLVLAGIILSTNVAMSGGGSAIDYRDIASQLTPRGAVSAEGEVTYHQYRFRISSQLFDQLADLLAASQDDPQPNVTDQVQSWLESNLPPEREAWSGICAFRPDQWQDSKQRIPGVDTTAATFQSLATASGATAAPITNEVVRHSNGVTETTIEDGLTVFRKPVSSMVHPLVPMDISLGSWQDAIDSGATVQGQEIHGVIDGQINSIIYTNSLADGSWLATEYSFDPDLDWAPRHVRSYDDEGTSLRIIFGYAPTAPEALMRPRAVAKGEVLEGGDVDAKVWVIDRWEESCDPAIVELREPALYLELDFMTDPNTPTATVREPVYLIGVEPCSKLQMAIAKITEAYGTDDREADYSYDGIVDSDDIEAVLEKFGSSGQ